jgi:hypothetical protein
VTKAAHVETPNILQELKKGNGLGQQLKSYLKTAGLVTSLLLHIYDRTGLQHFALRRFVCRGLVEMENQKLDLCHFPRECTLCETGGSPWINLLVFRAVPVSQWFLRAQQPAGNHLIVALGWAT